MTKPVIVYIGMYYSPPIGGAEISIRNYLIKLKDYYEIYAVCFLDEGRKFTKEESFDDNGINVIRTCDMIDIATIKSIDLYNPNLIITQLKGSDIVVNEAFKNKIPCIYFANDVCEDICFGYLKDCEYNDPLICKHLSFCPCFIDLKSHLKKYKKCEYIICCSEYLFNVFYKIFPEILNKLKIIYPDFNYELFKYQEKKDLTKNNILAINPNPTKGRDLIVEIANKNKDFNFTYVGCKKSDFIFLKDIPNIKCLGRVERTKMSQLYLESNVMVAPSLVNETFSMVTCESILSGTPVVGSNRGNLKNIIIDGQNGYIVNSSDPDKWSKYIRMAFNLKLSKNNSENLIRSLDLDYNFKKIGFLFDRTIENF